MVIWQTPLRPQLSTWFMNDPKWAGKFSIHTGIIFHVSDCCEKMSNAKEEFLDHAKVTLSLPMGQFIYSITLLFGICIKRQLYPFVNIILLCWIKAHFLLDSLPWRSHLCMKIWRFLAHCLLLLWQPYQ